MPFSFLELMSGLLRLSVIPQKQSQMDLLIPEIAQSYQCFFQEGHTLESYTGLVLLVKAVGRCRQVCNCLNRDANIIIIHA